MVKIRLALNKGAASYSIVAIDSKNKRDGRFIKKLGHYNPKLPETNPQRLHIDVAGVNEFISKGAQPTERITKLMSKVASQSVAA